MHPTPTFLLVHGAWHGSWCWELLLPELSALRVPTRVVDLPTADAGSAADLNDDAAAIRSAVAAIDGDVVVVAHSYGGAPVSQALVGLDNVCHIVYLAAFVLESGTSLFEVMGGEVPPWWEINGDSIAARTPAKIFYSDMTESEAAPFVAQMRPHGRLAYSTTISGEAWKTVPSTYIVCGQDASLPPEIQRVMASRLPSVVEIDSDHSPFASQPRQLAILLKSLVPAQPE